MASFCTKCGAPTPEGSEFCTACGSPLASAPPSAPPVYGQPAVAQPSASGGSSALKIVLIVVAVVVGLGLISALMLMFGAWRLSRAVHVNDAGGVTVSTPGGTISAGPTTKVSAEDLGIEIYPGAIRQEGGMQIQSARGSTITAVYSTSDSFAKVIEFYKGQMGQNASVFQTDKGAIISQAGRNEKGGVVVTVSSEDSSDGRPTKIAIMRTKSD